MQRAALAAGQPWEARYRHVKTFSYAAHPDGLPTTFEVCRRRDAVPAPLKR